MASTHVAAAGALERGAAAARTLALAAALALAACGGGGGSEGASSAACDTATRKAGLSTFFDDWYLWTRISPKPPPSGSEGLDDYFRTLLYPGGVAPFPADRWSHVVATDEFERRFGEGRTLGYGLFVAGLEVTGRADLPLLVRYVEPQSPAAAAALARGDRILALNGRSAAELNLSGDFAMLNASHVGEPLRVDVATPSGSRSVTLAAAIFDLQPVPGHRVVASAQGRRVGYVLVKDMIAQALPPIVDAVAAWRASGVDDVVLDLRYNGGGLVATGRDLASQLAGPRGSGRTYARLLYNDKRSAANDFSYLFQPPLQGGVWPRVYLLVGERTCSASEQLISGLQAVMDVVLVGRTTCGKPVGFLPRDDGCGSTYNVVNFESVNDRQQGRYFDGLRPTCAASEDLSLPLGSPAEPLLATALAHADGAGCVAPSAADRARALGVRRAGGPGFDGERPEMIAR